MPQTRTHEYEIEVTWTGDLGSGTSGYRAYSRDHRIEAAGKPEIPASSDPAFRGDGSRYNPEELLVASLSSCHMLWYLHLCADAGIVVTGYRDVAKGTMLESAGGGGRFEEVVLAPVVRLRPGSDPALAGALHEEAHAKCFIASSVSFPVRCRPVFEVDNAVAGGTSRSDASAAAASADHVEQEGKS